VKTLTQTPKSVAHTKPPMAAANRLDTLAASATSRESVVRHEEH
jgi:hypothetical protein